MAHVHPSLPKTMNAAVMTGIREPLEVRAVSLPEIGPEDALVQIVASGICRSDWHLWNGDWKWFMNLPKPAVLGHEMGGVIAAVGSAVKQVKVGQRVTIPFNIACGHCPVLPLRPPEPVRQSDHPADHSGLRRLGGIARVPTADLNCIGLPDAVDELRPPPWAAVT